MCLLTCIFCQGLSKDCGHSKESVLPNKLQHTYRLAWVVFPAERSISSTSMVPSLHNHIHTNLKSHTCCNTIYLETRFIASCLFPKELGIFVCFVFVCASLCEQVLVLILKPLCISGLVCVFKEIFIFFFFLCGSSQS